MEAIAKHDFRATAPDQLSFQKGDILKVTNTVDNGHWYLAQLGARKGYVPSTYTELRSHEWYYGKFSRSKTEEILFYAPKGAFLVRDSECTPDEFSLSVRSDSGVQHFKVYEDSLSKYYIWSVKFDTLNELVEYYRSQSISRAETILLRNIPKRFQVRALYDFRACEPDELEFQKEDLITVLFRPEGGWWVGELNARRGHFPATYVSPTSF